MKSLEQHKQTLVEELCEFVRIPSRSTPAGGEEGNLQTLMAQRMRQAGARVRTFEARDIPEFFTHELCSGPQRQYKNRPTIIGEIGPENAPALLILAHSDTVPITKPDAWTFDPFCGDLQNEKILGLGASDDKWGLVTMLGIMRALRDSQTPLKKKLVFASTIDEENGIGNGTLLLMLAGVQADAALYLDGYGMDLCLGNLGGSFFFLKPKAPIDGDTWARHGEILGRMCKEISLDRADLFDSPLLQNNIRRENSLLLYEWQNEAGPYFNVAFYTVPGESCEEFCDNLRAGVDKAMGSDLSLYSTSYHQPWFEPAAIAPTEPMVRHMSNALRDVLGIEPTLTTISKQDSFVLTNRANIPALAFGPRDKHRGNGAHQPDEYLTVKELWDGFRVAFQAVQAWLES